MQHLDQHLDTLFHLGLKTYKKVFNLIKSSLEAEMTLTQNWALTVPIYLPSKSKNHNFSKKKKEEHQVKRNQYSLTFNRRMIAPVIIQTRPTLKMMALLLEFRQWLNKMNIQVEALTMTQ